MSKSTELDTEIKTMLLGGVDLSGYDMDESTMTQQEKIGKVHEIFMSEYGWAVDRYGKQGAIREWLQGLPSCLSYPWKNYDIIQYAIRIGSLPANPTEKQQDKILENYFNLLAAKLDQLFRGYRLPL